MLDPETIELPKIRATAWFNSELGFHVSRVTSSCSKELSSIRYQNGRSSHYCLDVHRFRDAGGYLFDMWNEFLSAADPLPLRGMPVKQRSPSISGMGPNEVPQGDYLVVRPVFGE